MDRRQHRVREVDCGAVDDRQAPDEMPTEELDEREDRRHRAGAGRAQHHARPPGQQQMIVEKGIELRQPVALRVQARR